MRRCPPTEVTQRDLPAPMRPACLQPERDRGPLRRGGAGRQPACGSPRWPRWKAPAADQISFFTNPRYRRAARANARGGGDRQPRRRPSSRSCPRIVCDDPYAYFARLSAFLNPPRAPSARRPCRAPRSHPVRAGRSQRIDRPARGGCGGCGDRRAHGLGTRLQHRQSARGSATTACMYANVAIYHDCVIGDRVILHAGAVVGADGFGTRVDGGRWRKIPQIGRVLIGDDVESEPTPRSTAARWTTR